MNYEKPIQTNLDDIYLDEIKTIDDIPKSNQPNTNRIIRCCDGYIEVDENDNCLDVKIDNKKRSDSIQSKRLKLFHLISSPHIDHFVPNKLVVLSSNIGKKALKTVDYLGENVIKVLGITDSKYQNEISTAKQRTN